jgi:hypothetical protein
MMGGFLPKKAESAMDQGLLPQQPPQMTFIRRQGPDEDRELQVV